MMGSAALEEEIIAIRSGRLLLIPRKAGHCSS